MYSKFLIKCMKRTLVITMYILTTSIMIGCHTSSSTNDSSIEISRIQNNNGYILSTWNQDYDVLFITGEGKTYDDFLISKGLAPVRSLRTPSLMNGAPLPGYSIKEFVQLQNKLLQDILPLYPRDLILEKLEVVIFAKPPSGKYNTAFAPNVALIRNAGISFVGSPEDLSTTIYKTFSHELGHLLTLEFNSPEALEYNLRKKWEQTLPDDFSYNQNWEIGFTPQYLKNGFVSKYAMSNYEEDVAEFFSFMLSKDYNRYISKEFLKDNIFFSVKQEILLAYFHVVFPEIDENWFSETRHNAPF